MQHDISIALLQTDLKWKDKNANLSGIENIILSIKEKVDLIILPEMFSTAFCVDDMSLAETIDGETVNWMKELATSKNAAICGSILFKEDDLYFNRFLFISPDGKIHTYDKKHLFSLVHEQEYLTNGKEKMVIEFKNWKIQPFICYDLRFPAWCQNNDNTDLQIYVANWPRKRIHHWKTLLQARAIENQCYTIGVNRVGNDFFENEHNGCSAVFDFSGNELVSMDDKNGITIVNLSKDLLQQHKNRYPFWKDR